MRGLISEVDKKAVNYYEEVIRNFRSEFELQPNLEFIVVDHCLVTFQSHIESLSKLGKISGVILKSSTRVLQTVEYAHKSCAVINVTKEDLRDPEIALATITRNSHDGFKMIILDHGGYFAPSLPQLVTHLEFSSKVMGIVEVTENGHWKYLSRLKSLKLAFPILSIARSEIKSLEDAQVGISIYEACNSILYGIHSAFSSTQRVCVIGYGKIGQSIANCCRGNRMNVVVLETDSLRAQFALKDGHQVYLSNDKVKKSILGNIDIIFSCTGKQALTATDLKNFKKTVYIASCTSPDDEFSPCFFDALNLQAITSKEERELCLKNLKILPFKLFDGKEVNIFNGGKAVNFAVGGTPGYEICQVWATILYSTMKIASESFTVDQSIQEPCKSSQVEISKITCKMFLSMDDDRSLVKSDELPRSIGEGLFAHKRLLLKSQGTAHENKIHSPR